MNRHRKDPSGRYRGLTVSVECVGNEPNVPKPHPIATPRRNSHALPNLPSPSRRSEHFIPYLSTDTLDKSTFHSCSSAGRLRRARERMGAFRQLSSPAASSWKPNGTRYYCRIAVARGPAVIGLQVVPIGLAVLRESFVEPAASLVGMTMDEPGFVAPMFSKNQERLLEQDVPRRFFSELVRQAKVEHLLSEEHFTVGGGTDRVAGLVQERPSQRRRRWGDNQEWISTATAGATLRTPRSSTWRPGFFTRARRRPRSSISRAMSWPRTAAVSLSISRWTTS